MVYINAHTEDLDVATALARVSAQRREQVLRFRHEGSRRLCLAAYLLLMDGLREGYGLAEPPVFDYSTEGKPFIATRPDIHFSLSHSKTVALCAISDQPVGADVEVIRHISSELVDYTMNEAERARIRASQDPDSTFMELWTRKEAVLKLTGEGIRNDVKAVLAEEEKYQIETVWTDKYIFSIAKFKNVPENS